MGLAEAAIALEYLEYMRGRVAGRTTGLIELFARPRSGTRAGIDPGGGGAGHFVYFASTGPLPFDRFAETADQRLFCFDEPISESAGRAHGRRRARRG